MVSCNIKYPALVCVDGQAQAEESGGGQGGSTDGPGQSGTETGQSGQGGYRQPSNILT